MKQVNREEALKKYKRVIDAISLITSNLGIMCTYCEDYRFGKRNSCSKCPLNFKKTSCSIFDHPYQQMYNGLSALQKNSKKIYNAINKDVKKHRTKKERAP